MDHAACELKNRENKEDINHQRNINNQRSDSCYLSVWSISPTTMSLIISLDPANSSSTSAELGLCFVDLIWFSELIVDAAIYARTYSSRWRSKSPVQPPPPPSAPLLSPLPLLDSSDLQHESSRNTRWSTGVKNLFRLSKFVLTILGISCVFTCLSNTGPSNLPSWDLFVLTGKKKNPMCEILFPFPRIRKTSCDLRLLFPGLAEPSEWLHQSLQAALGVTADKVIKL